MRKEGTALCAGRSKESYLQHCHMSVGVTSNIYGDCKRCAYKVTSTLNLLLTGAHTHTVQTGALLFSEFAVIPGVQDVSMHKDYEGEMDSPCLHTHTHTHKTVTTFTCLPNSCKDNTYQIPAPSRHQ
jgi:hypothetical protein